MADFVRLAATAKRLIEANGRLVTITKDDKAPSDPAKPWRGPDDVETPPDGAELISIRMAFVPPAGTGFGSNRRVDGTLQDTLSKIGLVAQNSLPVGTNLSDFNWVIDGTRVFHIEFADDLAPADTVMIYTLGLTE